MKVYHGTNRQNARSIIRSGFRPIAWFTRSMGYAQRRAGHKARSHNDAVVLTCDLNLGRLKDAGHRVWGKGGIYAVNKVLPASTVKGFIEVPFGGTKEKPTALLGGSRKVIIESLSKHLSAWANELLGLKHYKGVKPSHAGVNEIARWIFERYDGDFDSVPETDLLHKACQWLPEFFEGVEIDWDRRSIYRRIRDVRLKPEPPEPVDPREIEALDCLSAETPKRVIRGLKLLAEIGNEDLFDWCMMCISDESTDVVVAALQTTLDCETAYPDIIEPLADSSDKRIRAAAIAALAKHSDEGAPFWFERGLKDRETCVRLETAMLLSELDPREHQGLFELARYDPNPAVRNLGLKFTAGKGYHTEW